MKRTATIIVLLAGLAVVSILKTASAQDTSAVNIPLKAGTVSTNSSGSIAICLNPNTFNEEPCTTKNVLAVPLTILNVGTVTGDGQGHGCQSVTAVVSNFPVDASPPDVTPNENTVIKITDYDPRTSTGDNTFTTYIGGHCVGAYFDKTGATLNSSGTGHFVVSENGNRVDGIVTSLTNPTNSIGDFSLHTVNHALVTTNP
jgi:hypothetical protein